MLVQPPCAADDSAIRDDWRPPAADFELSSSHASIPEKTFRRAVNESIFWIRLARLFPFLLLATLVESLLFVKEFSREIGVMACWTSRRHGGRRDRSRPPRRASPRPSRHSEVSNPFAVGSRRFEAAIDKRRRSPAAHPDRAAGDAVAAV